MDETVIKDWHHRMKNQRQIILEACRKALLGEISLTAAVEALEASDPKSQDGFSSVYPEAEPLSTLAYEVSQNPAQRVQIEAKYEAEARTILEWLLEEFTNLENPQHRAQLKAPLREPQRYPWPRSEPEEPRNH